MRCWFQEQTVVTGLMLATDEHLSREHDQRVAEGAEGRGQGRMQGSL